MRDCCVELFEHWGENWKHDEVKKRLSRDSNPVQVDIESVHVNTELLMSQLSKVNFLHIMLLSFEIGFLGVWFSRRLKSARSYLHSRCANRGSHGRL